MKKFVSVLLLLTMVLSVFVIAPASTADAATNSATSFQSGNLIKVGSYYFSHVFDINKQMYYIYRTKTDGTGTTIIGKGNTFGPLCAYNNVVYFWFNNRVYAHNVKTLKTTTLRQTEYQILGICSGGLITQNGDSPLYLLNYKGRFKKISGDGCHFLAATNTDVFISKTVNSYKVDYTPYETVRVYRYNLATAKITATGTFRSVGSYNGIQALAQPFDRHVFKGSIVFTYGNREGSAAMFNGCTYAMNADGTNIKKVINKSESVITPGSDCVYVTAVESGGDYYTVYRIGNKGSITGKAKKTRVIYTTAANYSLSLVKAGSSSTFNLYANSKVNAANGRCVINASRYIRSSDPSDAYASVSISGSVGHLVLATVSVYTYQGAVGWRARTLRSNFVLLNARNGAVTKLN